MGTQIVLTDVQVSINAIDVTDFCSQVTISQSIDEADVTTFGSGGARQRVAALGDGQFGITLFQAWGANTVNDILDGLVGTVTAIKVKPRDLAIGATNPEYQFNCLITEWQPMAANAGEVATVDATWPIDGPIVRDIIP